MNSRSDREIVPKANIVQEIIQIRNKYQEIIPVDYQPKGILHMENGMYFTFLVRWKSIPTNGQPKEEFEGIGICQMTLNEDRQWRVEGIVMPEFKF
ncbi:MAG: hypothetical protein AAGJ18_10825 [Bacteroidota bacterium]